MLFCVETNKAVFQILYRGCFCFIFLPSSLHKFAYFKYSNFQYRNLILELEFVFSLPSSLLPASFESYKTFIPITVSYLKVHVSHNLSLSLSLS